MANVPNALRSLIGRVSSEMGFNSLNLCDTSEKVIISSLALTKMLRHGRAGIPMEVMGLMLGEYIDEFTINVVDVFSMPQSGNTVSVEAVDPVYQAEMLDMLKRIGKTEMVVGWYHSHPGFGCWLSGTDINTQESFEQLDKRAIAVVVDPVQSVKGAVVLDCFRLIPKSVVLLNFDPHQVNSNIGNVTRPNITSIIHGLNKHYYNLVIGYSRSPIEKKLLLTLIKKSWIDHLQPKRYETYKQETTNYLAEISKLVESYKNQIDDYLMLSDEELILKKAGSVDARKQLAICSNDLLKTTILENVKNNIMNNILL